MSDLKIPSHVGIIMDGNGRWAEKRGKKRSYGHRVGSENVERVVEHAFKVGVKSLTLYAFSSENWARPKEEVDEYMNNTTIEGLYTLKSIYKLLGDKKVDMPVIDLIYDIIYNDADPKKLVTFLIEKK